MHGGSRREQRRLVRSWRWWAEAARPWPPHLGLAARGGEQVDGGVALGDLELAAGALEQGLHNLARLQVAGLHGGGDHVVLQHLRHTHSRAQGHTAGHQGDGGSRATQRCGAPHARWWAGSRLAGGQLQRCAAAVGLPAHAVGRPQPPPPRPAPFSTHARLSQQGLVLQQLLLRDPQLLQQLLECGVCGRQRGGRGAAAAREGAPAHQRRAGRQAGAHAPPAAHQWAQTRWPPAWGRTAS